MSIYLGGKQGKLYKGDYHPAQFYRGDTKIAGYDVVQKQGTAIECMDTYNDALNPTIYGKSEQTVTANSPSPDYPSPIRSSENFDAVSCGRNLVNIQDTTIVITNTYYKDSATGFTLHPNTRYTLSFDYVINSTSGELFAGIGYGVSFYAKDIAVGALYPNQTAGRTVAVFNSGDIGFDKKLFVRFVRSITKVTANVDISNVQLEFGTTTTPYEPYHATTAHVTDPLRSVGDVSDSIEVSEGKVEVVRRCWTKAFDGSEAWTIYNTGTGTELGYTVFFTNLSQIGVAPDFHVSMCTNALWWKYGYANSISGNCHSLTSNGGMFMFKTNLTATTTVTAFKEWLASQATAGTPVIVQYQLETPTRTDITATPLGQALLALRTQPHYTQVYTDAEIQPMLMAKMKELLQ